MKLLWRHIHGSLGTGVRRRQGELLGSALFGGRNKAARNFALLWRWRRVHVCKHVTLIRRSQMIEHITSLLLLLLSLLPRNGILMLFVDSSRGRRCSGCRAGRSADKA